MVVNRCAAEESFSAGVFEVSHLDDYAHKFHDEDAAYDEKEYFVSGHHCTVAYCGSQRQRADITHKDLRRVTVEPEEAEYRACDCGEEYGKFAGLGDMRMLPSSLLHRHRQSPHH